MGDFLRNILIGITIAATAAIGTSVIQSRVQEERMIHQDERMVHMEERTDKLIGHINKLVATATARNLVNAGRLARMEATLSHMEAELHSSSAWVRWPPIGGIVTPREPQE